jgi:hypothetical protein
MSDTALSRAQMTVKVIAQTAVDNETYFCELDAVVGDGDFGYSLARGFEIVLSDFDELEYDDGSFSVRFCSYTHSGRFQRNPLMVSADDMKGLARALKEAPRLRKLVGGLVAQRS